MVPRVNSESTKSANIILVDPRRLYTPGPSFVTPSFLRFPTPFPPQLFHGESVANLSSLVLSELVSSPRPSLPLRLSQSHKIPGTPDKTPDKTAIVRIETSFRAHPATPVERLII